MFDREYELAMEQIELILQEADRYGLRYEVKETADAYLKNDPDMDAVDAFQQSLADWLNISITRSR